MASDSIATVNKDEQSNCREQRQCNDNPSIFQGARLLGEGDRKRPERQEVRLAEGYTLGAGGFQRRHTPTA